MLGRDRTRLFTAHKFKLGRVRLRSKAIFQGAQYDARQRLAYQAKQKDISMQAVFKNISNAALQVHGTLVEAVENLAPGGVYKKPGRDERGLPGSPPPARAPPRPRRTTPGTARLHARRNRGPDYIAMPMPQYPIFSRPRMKICSPFPPQFSSSSRIALKTLTKDIDNIVEEMMYYKDFTNGCFTKDGFTDSGFNEDDFGKSDFTETGFIDGAFTQGSFTEGDFTEGGFTEHDQTEAAPWERCHDDEGDFTMDNFSNGDLDADNFTVDSCGEAAPWEKCASEEELYEEAVYEEEVGEEEVCNEDTGELVACEEEQSYDDSGGHEQDFGGQEHDFGGQEQDFGGREQEFGEQDQEFGGQEQEFVEQEQDCGCIDEYDEEYGYEEYCGDEDTDNGFYY